MFPTAAPAVPTHQEPALDAACSRSAGSYPHRLRPPIQFDTVGMVKYPMMPIMRKVM